MPITATLPFYESPFVKEVVGGTLERRVGFVGITFYPCDIFLTSAT
jgi:hypothetical protein